MPYGTSGSGKLAGRIAGDRPVGAGPAAGAG